MGLFSKLFSAKEQPSTDKPIQETSPEGGISVMMLYREIPRFDIPSLKKRLETAFGNEVTEVSGSADEKASFIQINFGTDSIMVAGLHFQYPTQVLDGILPVCHFAAAEKQKFYSSQAHILLSYKNESAPAHIQYDRLYRVAGCLLAEDGNAIGIVNESATTAHPINLLEKIQSERDELLKEKSMPFMSWLLWTGGCVKYILDENTIWFVTKGNHAFGLPELAFKGNPNQGNSSMEIFNALFAYMYFYKAKLAVGHTADIGDLKLKFTAVTEYKEAFEGKFGTLAVNFI